jgi:hypothetical protein
MCPEKGEEQNGSLQVLMPRLEELQREQQRDLESNPPPSDDLGSSTLEGAGSLSSSSALAGGGGGEMDLSKSDLEKSEAGGSDRIPYASEEEDPLDEGGKKAVKKKSMLSSMFKKASNTVFMGIKVSLALH